MSRPNKHPVDILFGKLWFANAARVQGNATPYWFWKYIDNKQGDKSNWERYKRGLRIPESSGAGNPIDKIETVFPGTARLFHSPAKTVLKGGQLSQKAAVKGISEIGDPIKRIILQGGYDLASFAPNEGGTLEAMFKQLALFPSLGQLEEIILLLGWADAIGNPQLWNYICSFYRFMIPELVRVGDLLFPEELLDLVDEIAQMRTFKSVNYRSDIFQSWRDDKPQHLIREEQLQNEMREYFESMKPSSS
jgi:hypothetical protein